MESFFFFKLLAESQKYSNEWRSVNIDQSVMCYISMDSSQEALQSNVKLASNFSLWLGEEANVLKADLLTWAVPR